MRIALVIVGSLVAGCSAANSDPQSRYERAIECEVIVGVLGASHPELTRDQVVQFTEANAAYNRRSEEIGAELGKTPLQIDGDRRAFVPTLRARLRGGESERAVGGLMEDAQHCVTELG